MDLTGKKFGKWTALFRVISARTKWLCRCDCGNESAVFADNLRSGHSTGCRSCCAASRIAHGGATRSKKNSAYFAWKHMMYRCYDSKHPNFRNYGARGITVCNEWHDFQTFHADMGEPPEGLTIERVDNGAAYSKANCTWGTHKEQNRNKRTNVLAEHGGETKCLSAWAEEYGIPYNAFWKRWNAGWSIKKILSTGVRPSSRTVRSRKITFAEMKVVRVNYVGSPTVFQF